MRGVLWMLVTVLAGACAHAPDAKPMDVQAVERTRWRWERGPALPAPRSNVAVAAAGEGVFAGLGLGPGRTHVDIVRDAWLLEGDRWRALPPVPGSAGRLAATAVHLRGQTWLMGGYTVAQDGAEVSTPDVFRLDPQTQSWTRAPDMPVPVDDAVSAVHGTSIVLVSGWHQRDNVDAVQRFDTRTQRWSSLPAFPGEPVFGHAGGIVEDTLITCDGVGVDRDRAQPFFAVAQCHTLELAVDPPRWSKLEHHGRPTRYRAAAGVLPSRGWIVFAGGTARPYNYDGVGYDGHPAQARDEVFAFDVQTRAWVELPALPVASMDSRGLVARGDSLWMIGGMRSGGVVHDEVWILRAEQVSLPAGSVRFGR